MIKTLLTICLSLGFTFLSLAESWTQMANFGGVARHRSSTFTIGNKGYLGLGHINSVTNILYEDFWEYDPATNSWAQVADYPEGGCYHAASFSIGNKGYVGSGRLVDNSYTPHFYAYTSSTNTWEILADIPGNVRRGAVGFAVNGIGYVGTGQTYSGNSADFYSYDPNTDTWTTIAPLPGPNRTSSVAFNIGDKGYVGTGGNGGGMNDFYEYDPATGIWTQKADVGPIGRQEATGFSVNGKGYIGTGDDFSSGNNFKDFWMYEPSTDTWSQIEDFTGVARRYLVSMVIEGKAYAGTGTSGTNFRDFWQFDHLLSLASIYKEQTEITIYPNPSQGEFKLKINSIPTEINSSELEIKVYSISGQMIESNQIVFDNMSLLTSEVESGFYFYELTWKDKVLKQGKLIKS